MEAIHGDGQLLARDLLQISACVYGPLAPGAVGDQPAQLCHRLGEFVCLLVPECGRILRLVPQRIVRVALDGSPLFFAAALPRRVFPPLFNLYKEGNGFGDHIDNAVRFEQNGQPVRTDLSATLFLSDPGEYDGGELVVGASSGTHRVKLPAGDMVLYPATTIHKVEAITRGERLASFFWIQSMVRDEGERTLLFNLDVAIQKLNQDHPGHPSSVELVGVYHNLLRKWAEL